MAKNKSLLEEIIIPDLPEDEDEPVPTPAPEAEVHPKKKAAQRKAARKSKADPPASKGKSKAVPKPKPQPEPERPVLSGDMPFCGICGRALSKPSSVDQGMGDVCAGRHKRLGALGVSSMAEHIENNTVLELPDGYMKVKDAHAEIMRTRNVHGISGHRFIQAFGGNGLLLPPVNEHFKVVFYKGTRYLPASCLNHLEDLKKV